MRYSWLFPIAFIWRHFSNEEFWTALQKARAVLQNQRPNFACMENTMRAFAAQGVSYHGGLFYSGSTLTQYCFPSGAKLPDWTDCPESMDFIAREVLAPKIVLDGNWQRRIQLEQRRRIQQQLRSMLGSWRSLR